MKEDVEAKVLIVVPDISCQWGLVGVLPKRNLAQCCRPGVDLVSSEHERTGYAFHRYRDVASCKYIIRRRQVACGSVLAYVHETIVLGGREKAHVLGDRVS